MIHDVSESASQGFEQAMGGIEEKRCQGCKGESMSPPSPQNVSCPKQPKCKEPEPCPTPEPCPKCPSAPTCPSCPACPPVPDDSGLRNKIENQDEELTHLYNENNQLISGIEQMRLITNELNKKVA